MNRGWLSFGVLVAVVLVGLLSYKKGVDAGKVYVQGQWDKSVNAARAENQKVEHERQDGADEASRQGAAALVTVEDDAASARSAGDRLREQLAASTRRAVRESAELAGERKAAAARERVYTELLARSTTAIEFYAREADRNRAYGLTCEQAWPKK